MSHDKSSEKRFGSKPEMPDPKLSEAAAQGDPMAKALAEEVARDERHPATKSAMAARRADAPSLKEVVENLLAAGGHQAQCPTRSMSQAVCVCPWGDAEAAARLALDLRKPRPADVVRNGDGVGVGFTDVPVVSQVAGAVPASSATAGRPLGSEQATPPAGDIEGRPLHPPMSAGDAVGRQPR